LQNSRNRAGNQEQQGRSQDWVEQAALEKRLLEKPVSQTIEVPQKFLVENFVAEKKSEQARFAAPLVLIEQTLVETTLVETTLVETTLVELTIEPVEQPVQTSANSIAEWS
jgi:2-oxoglutarate dehydrogenase complex dehydrogenase (E1) component-like enzyme